MYKLNSDNIFFFWFKVKKTLDHHHLKKNAYKLKTLALEHSNRDRVRKGQVEVKRPDRKDEIKDLTQDLPKKRIYRTGLPQDCPTRTQTK